MADDFSTRDELEKEANDLKSGAKTLAQPLEDKLYGKLEDEIAERFGRHIADNAAKNAANGTAESAGAAGATTKAANDAAAKGEADAAGKTVAGQGGTTGTTVGSTGGTTVATEVGGTTAGGTTTAGTVATAGGTAAEGATAGAAAGPPGIVVGAIIGAIIAFTSAIKNETDVSLDNDNPDAPKLNVIVMALAAFLFFFFMVGGTLISKGVAAPVSVGQETEFQQTVVKGKNMSEAGVRYKEGTDLKTFDRKKPLRNPIWNYTFGTDESGLTDGLRQTLSKALRRHCKSLVAKLEDYTFDMNGHTYNEERSLSTFYENRFPYDLSRAGYEPTIGDVLIPNSFFYDKEYKEWNPRFDDVNYAEIFAVLGMSDSINGADYGFNWGNINYKDFMEFLQKEECIKYMYELGLKWVPVYKGIITVVEEDGTVSTHEEENIDDKYDTPEECREAVLTKEIDGVIYTWDDYFVEVTVKPFGLRELFAIAFLAGGESMDDVNLEEKAQAMHIEFDQHSNLYMLNYSERVTRLYQRGLTVSYKIVETGEVVSTVDALGPSCMKPRSENSPVYDDVNNSAWLKARNWEGSGRSPWWYIKKTYNDDFTIIEWVEDPGGATPPGEDFTPPKKMKKLKMQQQIYQGDYPHVKRGASNTYVSKKGCIDCCVCMIAMYYKGAPIWIGDVSKYTNSSGNLETSTALAAYGLRRGADVYTDVLGGIVNEIDNDRPVIIHIKGKWVSGVKTGFVIHRNAESEHFLIAYGYDESGIYVQDPGNRYNNYIYYSDFGHVADLYYRPVYKN